MAKRKVYAFSLERNRNHIIVTTKQGMIKHLGENVYDHQDFVVAGWCGISSADYKKAESMVRKISKPHNVGLLVCGYGDFRVFDSWEDFQNYVTKYNKTYEIRKE